MNAKKLNISVRAATLAAPSVSEADADNHVAATVTTVTVVVPVWSGMATGDRVDLLWAPDVTANYTDYVPVSAAMVSGKVSPTFSIPSSEIATNHEAAISYVVTPADGSDSESSDVYTLSIGEVELLPAPAVDEADGTTISVDDNPDGVTVTVPATANLVAGDVVTVYWTGNKGTGTTSVSETVSGNGAGTSLTFHISADVLAADAGISVKIYYTVIHSSGSEGTSATVSYDISGEAPSPGNGTLKVMGARSQTTQKRAQYKNTPSSPIRQLVALDADTLTELEADWQYEGASESVTASRFRDVEPNRLLHVSTTDDHVILNVSNINSSGGAMVALRDAGDIVAWGGSDFGGEVPATIVTLTDIVETAGSGSAFAARRKDGSVVAWGDSDYGGEVPSTIATLTGITSLASSGGAFAALHGTGSVVAWGDNTYGSVVPDDIAALTDITSVLGNYCSFAALRSTGSVVAWGDSTSGGEVPSTITTLNDIVEITGSGLAFAARRENGSVVAWGDSDYGGEVPSTIATLNDIVEVVSNGTAFAARRKNGSVVAWGNSNSGGEVPADIVSLVDVVSISGAGNAFCALRANGSVMVWGEGVAANVPSSIAALDDIVQVTGMGPGVGAGTNGNAFAALQKDGSVVAWGWGGDISNDIQSLLTDVRAVYDGVGSFAALTSDSRVVTWGEDYFGGDSSAVQSVLNGYISYEATAASRGIALNRKG